MQNAQPDLLLVGVLQRVAIWVAWYGIALVGFFLFLTADIPFALLLIVFSELYFLFLRPQPKLGPASYAAPVPGGWQRPISALRWALLAYGFWSIAATALGTTVFFAIAAIVGLIAFILWPHAFGIANIAVLIIFTVWLTTRPLWIEPLRRSLKRNVNAGLGSYLPSIAVGADGLEIEIRFIVIGTPPQSSWHLSVPFAELEEVRMLDGLSAQGYLDSLQLYDPTIQYRMQWEIWQFYTGRVKRPAVFTAPTPAAGAQLLLRGPTLLYLIGNADETGSVAVAAWNAWRASHAAPAALA